MKNIYLTVALSILAAIGIGASVASASDISDAIYAGTIMVSNNSSAESNVAANVSANTSSWISHGFLSENMSNVTIRTNGGADTPFMPGYDGNPWMFWVPNIGQESYLYYTIYSGGNTSMGSRLRFFGTAVVNDAPTIEPGDNFTLETTCPIPDSTGNVCGKPQTFNIQYYDDTGNLTAAFPYGYTPFSSATAPDWTDKAKAYDDNNGTYAWHDGNSSRGYLTASAPSSLCYGIRWLAYDSVGGACVANVDIYYDGAWHDLYDGNTAVVFQYGWLDVPKYVTAARIDLSNAAHDCRLYEFQTIDTISVEYPVSEGQEYAISVSGNTTHLVLSLNGSEVDSTALGSGSIPNTAYDWYLFEGVPYAGDNDLNLIKIYQDGDLNCEIDWEFDSTFTDLSGNSNDATPSFRTDCTAANVSAELISFGPILESVVTSWTVADVNPMIQDNPDTPSRLYQEPEPENLFLAPLFVVLVEESGQLPATFWYPISILIITMAGVAIIKITNKSVMAQTIVQLILFFALSFTLLPWWTPIFYIFYALAINLGAKQFGGV